MNDRRVRNAELFWRPGVVGDEPAAEVHFARGRIEQLDGIDLRRIGVREQFIDENRRDIGRRVNGPRRTVDGTAGTPTLLIAPRFPRRVLIHDRE